MVLEARTSEETRWQVNAHFMTQADGTRGGEPFPHLSHVLRAMACVRVSAYVCLPACFRPPPCVPVRACVLVAAQPVGFTPSVTTTWSPSLTTRTGWHASRQHSTLAPGPTREVQPALGAQQLRAVQPQARPLALE